jgi:hypothetical protein
MEPIRKRRKTRGGCNLVPDLRYVFDLGIATRSDTLQYLKSCREASEAEALGARTKVPITGDE